MTAPASGPATILPATVLVVFGTRPEAIKMLPLIVAARDHDGYEPVVVSTGQHAEMVAEVLAMIYRLRQKRKMSR